MGITSRRKRFRRDFPNSSSSINRERPRVWIIALKTAFLVDPEPEQVQLPAEYANNVEILSPAEVAENDGNQPHDVPQESSGPSQENWFERVYSDILFASRPFASLFYYFNPFFSLDISAYLIGK